MDNNMLYCWPNEGIFTEEFESETPHSKGSQDVQTIFIKSLHQQYSLIHFVTILQAVKDITYVCKQIIKENHPLALSSACWKIICLDTPTSWIPTSCHAQPPLFITWGRETNHFSIRCRQNLSFLRVFFHDNAKLVDELTVVGLEMVWRFHPYSLILLLALVVDKLVSGHKISQKRSVYYFPGSTEAVHTLKPCFHNKR